jgi:benzoyl-CoA reductase/2-hydroxyglutaryl-CoA dehydratase subunit BcrC/BadD/HgdB
MKPEKSASIGFSCAYMPLPLIHAAGLNPYRVLPQSDAPDQAGQLLHDNLCPHAKRVLDRAMAGDLPELSGMVFINSCDTMRRLADAWHVARPDDRTLVIDLPSTTGASSEGFLAHEYRRLADTLMEWGGKTFGREEIAAGIEAYNRLAKLLVALRGKIQRGDLPGGSVLLQEIYNRAACEAVETVITTAEELLTQKTEKPADDGVPIFLFGNVLPDLEALRLFEACGARIVEDDLCTGSRLIQEIEPGRDGQNPIVALARAALRKPPCARTFDTSEPGGVARTVLERAQGCGAKGVIGHTLKFCDPYLARIPNIRSVLRQAGMPLLLLEGDCTLGAIGQQQTRIEAFVEMLF